jgi:transcriptional regulator with XRE-family HTH domain
MSDSPQPQPKKVEILGRELRRLRKERKLSVAEVAERSNLDPQDLARIERGESRVGLETLFRLLSAFDVEPHELELLAAAGDDGPGYDARERFRRELSR